MTQRCNFKSDMLFTDAEKYGAMLLVRLSATVSVCFLSPPHLLQL